MSAAQHFQWLTISSTKRDAITVDSPHATISTTVPTIFIAGLGYVCNVKILETDWA
jgi:hypothetical protein